MFHFLFAGFIGFTHAFEIDHLLAVSSMVTRRKSASLAIKDGIFWGLGHSSTILLIGILVLLAQVAVSEQVFHVFEAGVGLMLTILGGQRLREFLLNRRRHAHAHAHGEAHDHRLAYGVGLVHGLAGSGTLVLLVMTELKTVWEGIFYLLIFGLGSVLGMLVASGVFFLPWSHRFSQNLRLQRALALLSSVLCVAVGCKVLLENLFHL